jgi:carbon storage regulator
MLVLTRRLNEELLIGDDIRVTVLAVKGQRVKLGIEAPADVPIVRPPVRIAKTDDELEAA